MSDQYLVEPDLGFVEEVIGLGGDTLKKCYQCATCSVACPIAPENSPFPRKEMIAASWGLKDKLIGSGDIWLCHECGDCTTLCPRGAKPGAVLSAVRSAAIAEYAEPKALGKMVNDPKKLPLLTAIPAAWFALMAFLTMVCGGIMESVFGLIGLSWSHGHGSEIAHANFVSTWLVDLTFVPLAGWVVFVLGKGLVNFVKDMHANAVLEGKTDKKEFNLKEYLGAVVKVVPTILKHDKFNECGENKDRSTAHMMVLFGFVGLFIVTNIFFVTLYVFHIPGPYSQLNPVKILANISGLSLVIGGLLMVKNRLSKEESSAYKDWYLIGLALGLGVTGMLSLMTRLAGSELLTYAMYYIHLIFIFQLFAYLPFSKMAHIAYRVAAVAYAEYGNRK